MRARWERLSAHLRALVGRAKKSKVLLPVAQLAGGSVAAQLITVLVSFATARIYAPEMFGAYTLLLTAVNLFSPILSLRYDYSIVVAKEEEVHPLVAASFLIMLGLVALLSAGLVFYFRGVAEIRERLGGFAYLVIPVLLFSGLVNLLTNYNNRYREYGIISSTQVLRTFVKNACYILFGLLRANSVSLLLSEAVGSVLGVSRQSRRLRAHWQQIRQVRWEEARQALVRYRNQPLYSAPAQLLNSASYSLLNFALTDLFGLAVFGYYSLSYRILTLPMTIISANVAKVFFQQAGQEKRTRGHYRAAFRRMALGLTAVAVPLLLFLLFLAPRVFGVFYGEKWEEAGVFVQIMAPLFCVRFVVASLTSGLIISSRQRLEMLMQGLFLAALGLVYLLARRLNWSARECLAGVTALYSLVYLLYFMVLYRLSREVSPEGGQVSVAGSEAQENE